MMSVLIESLTYAKALRMALWISWGSLRSMVAMANTALPPREKGVMGKEKR